MLYASVMGFEEAAQKGVQSWLSRERKKEKEN
jgi:hypothetical protein